MKDPMGNIITSENLKVHPRMKELYKFFKFNGKVIDIKDPTGKSLIVGYETNPLAKYNSKNSKL